jgi:hypothetical protein
MTPRRPRILVGLLAVVSLGSWTFLVAREQQRQDPLAEAFKGITTNGAVTPGLFPIRSTGVSTGPVRDAAIKFLASLTDEQRSRTAFAVDDDEWRKWNNVHRYARQGVSFKEMSGPQRELGFAMMRAGLSAKGFQKSRDVMKLNGYVAELGKTPEEYGEFLYHLTVMGTPSDKQPWGWQLDGHHLILNYFVLGDQVVMTANTPARKCFRTNRTWASRSCSRSRPTSRNRRRSRRRRRPTTPCHRRSATTCSSTTRA